MEAICRLLRIHIVDFFESIHIDYNKLKYQGWNTSRLIEDTKVYFYYHPSFDQELQTEFNRVFQKYIVLLSEIINPENKLAEILLKNTDTTAGYWKQKESISKILDILDSDEYLGISPSHIINIYLEICMDNPPDRKEALITRLDAIVDQRKQAVRNFCRGVKSTLLQHMCRDYQYGEINNLSSDVIREILTFMEILIDLKIYRISDMIEDNIHKYLDPNDIIGENYVLV